MPKMIISPQQARHHLIVARKIPLVLLLQKQFHTQEGACSMKNFVIQNRKIFVTTCVAVMLCVVTVLHFAEPQDEQIPKLNLPAVGNIVTEYPCIYRGCCRIGDRQREPIVGCISFETG